MGFHRATGSPLTQAANGRRVTEQLFQRRKGGDARQRSARFRRFNYSAALLQVAHYFAHIIIGSSDIELHYRLEQRGTALLQSLIERIVGGDAERHFVRPDFTRFAAQQRYPHAGQRERSDHATTLTTTAQLFERGCFQIIGQGSFAKAAIEHHDITGGIVERFKSHVQPREHLCRSNLSIALPNDVDRRANRFAIVHSRFVELDVQIEIACQSMLDHVQVQFAHTADQRLRRLFILDRIERWVLTLEHFQDFGKLLAFGRILWLDRHRDHRLRELNARQLNDLARIRTAYRR